MEPEYIAISANSKQAYVTLQVSERYEAKKRRLFPVLRLQREGPCDSLFLF